MREGLSGPKAGLGGLGFSFIVSYVCGREEGQVRRTEYLQVRERASRGREEG